MPQASLKATRDLKILLDRQRGSFTAGDTITGRVIRASSVDSTRARVTVQLFGRAKVLIKQSQGEGQACFRSRFHFFGNETTQALYDGPLKINSGDTAQEWSFSVSVPNSIDGSAVRQGPEQRYSYLSLGHNDVARLPPPSTFSFDGCSLGKKFDAYVEYWLEAGLYYDADGSTQTASAILPLVVQAPSTPFPITEFGLEKSTQCGYVSTQRLLPGLENSELTLMQKTQKTFRSAKVPRFGYTLEVDFPTVLQLENTQPVPFKLRVLPDAQRTSDVLADAKSPPTIILASLALKIKARTNLVAPGNMFCKPRVDKGSTYDLGTKKVPLKLAAGEPVTLPSRSDVEAVDVGELLRLRLTPYWAEVASAATARFEDVLSPSFTTFNIKHTHQLLWTVVMKIAGESVTHHGFHAISLLGPSEEKKA